jgi:hypothetical protein
MPADDLKDVLKMLLDVPVALCFTEVEIYSVGGCLFSLMGLVEACGGTLVKLSYNPSLCPVTSDERRFPPTLDGLEPSNRSFNFAKLPSLKEVKFTVHWTAGNLLWVSKALSTLEPATSQHLSIFRLNFRCPYKRTVPEVREKICLIPR